MAKKRPASSLKFSGFFSEYDVVDKDYFQEFIDNIKAPTVSASLQSSILATLSDLIRSRRLLQKENGMATDIK